MKWFANWNSIDLFLLSGVCPACTKVSNENSGTYGCPPKQKLPSFYTQKSYCLIEIFINVIGSLKDPVPFYFSQSVPRLPSTLFLAQLLGILSKFLKSCHFQLLLGRYHLPISCGERYSDSQSVAELPGV